MEKTAEQRGDDPVGRVGHHVERSPGQAQVGGVGTHHGDATPESFAQRAGPSTVGLDRDDPVPGVDERPGDRPAARADVDDQ